jgi:hypothetical protein
MSSLIIPKGIQGGYRTCRLCSLQSESKRSTGHVVFAHPKEIKEGYNACLLCLIPKRTSGVQDMSYLYIPKKIQEGYWKCRRWSFQRGSERGAGHVFFSHSKENPRGVQEMSSLFIPKRFQEGYRTCRLCSFQKNIKYLPWTYPNTLCTGTEITWQKS